MEKQGNADIKGVYLSFFAFLRKVPVAFPVANPYNKTSSLKIYTFF